MSGEGRMAAELYDAVSKGDVRKFREVVQQDPYIVETASFTCSRNVLHIATLRGKTAIVEEVLNINPQLARDLDSQQSSPLHIAVAKGSLEIVQKLLPESREACWWRDCHDMNPIHIAAMNGHDEVLKMLLNESHIPAMERLHRGQTVLHLCVKHGKLTTLKVLVEKLGELVYAKDDNGETFLDLAVSCNQDEMVQHLVAMENNNIKVLVDLVDEVSYARSRNLLQIAILRGHVDMVEGLLNTNPQLARDLDSQQSSPLHIAVAKGSLEIVKKLLLVAPEACWWRDCHDMNPIHIAAMNGHVDILEELLQESPLPAMERLHRAQTVLHLCVKHGQLDALKILVEKLGELVYAKDDNGETLMHLAVRCNQDEMVQHLVAMENNNIKVLVDLVDEVSYARSRNLLQIAILRGHVDMVEGLLNTNPQLARDLDSQQSSPLHIAVAKGSLEIVKKLLSVAPEACWWRDCHDMNPIHIAAMNGHVDILEELLQESPLPAMERLHRAQTVLHLCVKHGQLDALKILVEKLGELVYAKDDNGETLMHLAVRCNQDEMVQHLVAMENNNIKVLVDLVDEVSYARSRNFLQIAILRGHVDMVEGLLNTNPHLARDLDSQQSSPLHIAAAQRSLEGNVVIVRKLLAVAPEACWWRDCHDMNPIHIAAMNGHINILKELLERSHMPAMERLHRGQTVLHLCVKHGQLDALKVLVKKLGEFVYAVDDDRETLLHLAVRCNQLEILRYLWKSNRIIRIKRNSMGKTALQILDESPGATTPSYSEMRIILRSIPSEYMFEMDNVMMVVAILIATMAFQNSVTPPGGVWQDDTPSHKAGQAVIAYTHPDMYRDLVFANNMAFYLSFAVILLITSGLTSMLPVISVAVGLAMCGSIMSIVVSYGSSIKVISPNTFNTPIGYYIIYAGILIIAMLLGLKRAISWIFVVTRSFIYILYPVMRDY